MHYYSLDTEIRRKTQVYLALIASAVPSLFEGVRTILGLPPQYGTLISFGAVYSFLYYGFERYVWRWLSKLLGIPVLDGRWDAEGVSSYLDPETGQAFRFAMTVTIKQTFSKMEIFTETGQSTSRSTMSSICTQHAIPIFRYAFENIPKNVADQELQRHPGLIELRINSDKEMVGDYFSGKHRLRYGELTLRRDKD